ncbi:cytochrome c biogenesis protein CcsA [Desulfovibrio sp. OttesenSCG-928-G15]|nr:cytochrome c biogenesis protein CcsA [Desulfovibrio sp. OttesenSCG-928-G15]
MPLYSFASNLLNTCLGITLLAALFSLWQICQGYIAAAPGRSRPVDHGPLFAGSAFYPIVIGVFLTLCTVILTYAFINHDFMLEYVAQYSDKSLPLFYRITAVWAGQDGSLLFWAWSVGIGAAAFALAPSFRALGRETRLWYSLLFYLIMAFFMLLIAGWSNPFTLLSFTPENGRGLNPLLQNPGMIFHPPLLFLGYGGFVVPGCLALAQTLSGNLYDPKGGTRSEESWATASRPFILVAWSLLTAGIILGAWWAYMELGWGGYWAWDPVENASLIPWLVASAYLHTGVIGSRRNKLHRTNVFLMALTTISAFFATYLVRSGVVQSLHAFGSGSVGGPLLIFIFAFLFISIIALLCAPGKARWQTPPMLTQGLCLLVMGCIAYIAWSLWFVSTPPKYVTLTLLFSLAVLLVLNMRVAPEGEELEDLTSKEGLLMLVCWLLLAISLFILIATMWPVILATLQDYASVLPNFLGNALPEKPMGLEPAFYNTTCLPLFALLAVLLVFCPFRKWKVREFDFSGVNAKSAGIFAACALGMALVIGFLLYATLHITAPTSLVPLALALGALGGFAVHLFFYGQKSEGNFTQPKDFAFILLSALAMAYGLALCGIIQPTALLAASCAMAAMMGIAFVFFSNRGLLSIPTTLAAHGVHIGILLCILGVAFSGPYQQQYTLEMGRKQEAGAGKYRIVLNELYEGSSQINEAGDPNFHFLEAELLVANEQGEVLGKLAPQRRVYANFENQAYAEVDTLFSLGNEVYATLLGVDKANRATIAVNVNPLVNWLWIGGTIMSLFPFLGLGRVRRRTGMTDDSTRTGRAEAKA